MTKKTVYVVHAVDVEGPMTESLEATFERMWAYGLPPDVPMTEQSLRLIQDGMYPDLPVDLSAKLKLVFNRHSLGYLGDWAAIDAMLGEVNSPEFRKRFCGSDGSPYKFSWFIYDHHEDFMNNPRYHEVGTHRLFDHYHDLFLRENLGGDGIYWHYHPPANSGDALESNTCWSNHVTHERIIARRIIERGWYFSCFRAGLHIERNDVSHWLEMFVPFDFSARYMADPGFYKPGFDFDWRGCPSRWGGWHPDWYDYRRPGTMRRWQFRCTDLWTYLNILSAAEVEEAFLQAKQFGDAVLTYYNHDYRDMKFEIEQGYEVLRRVGQRHPDVEYVFVSALEAAQRHLGLVPSAPGLSYELHGNVLTVRAKAEIFGPQPFLAIKESGSFFRDNFTAEGGGVWVYRFRRPADVEAFGVAASSPSGVPEVMVHKRPL